jgi:hypothetical protein
MGGVERVVMFILSLFDFTFRATLVPYLTHNLYKEVKHSNQALVFLTI